MSLQPVIPLVILIPLALVCIVLMAWLCLRTLKQLKGRIKWTILSLRLATVCIFLVALLNPGEWKSLDDQNSEEWVLMVDTSASMDVNEGGKKRIDQITEHLTAIRNHSAEAGVNVSVIPFDVDLKQTIEDESTRLVANGASSQFEVSADQLLQRYASSGKKIGGVIVFSDGRQTTHASNSAFFMKAKSFATQFHTYTVGQDFPTADVAVSSPYRMVSAFTGQQIQITGHVKIKNSDQKFANLELLDDGGTVIETVKLDLSESGGAAHSFSLVTPEKTTYYTLRTSPIENEIRLANNEMKVNVRVLQSKTKVFIAEGAPYWDSKFFAQLLRQQKHMDVTSVYRLSQSRWFMVDSSSAKPFETDQLVFPDTVEKLAEYDLVVFGKNIDGFITPQIASNIKQYVRENGGAVLFARGQSFASQWTDLQALEPVLWSQNKIKQFKLLPTQEGEAIGLFGQVLPAKDSVTWSTLPPLQDARAVESVRPFTRVLAEGKSATGETFPLLMVRRYGQGVSGMINADGLWKWDFYPEVKEKGNMYNEFWSQLIQWMVSYSEFLPGYDYSLHLSSSTAHGGDTVSVKVGFRGDEVPETVQLLVESDQLSEPVKILPSKSIAQDGRIEWRTSLKYEQPGVYRIRVVTDSQAPLPETSLTIEAAPGEFDELNADPEYMRFVATETGGDSLDAGSIAAFLNNKVIKEEASLENGRVKWSSIWLHWLVAMLLVAILGGEWWLRRRNGLI